VLENYLEWEQQDYNEMVDSVLEAYEDVKAGRTQPARQFLEELRAKQDANAILKWLVLQHAGETGLRWFRRLEKAIASLSHLPGRCEIAPENASVPFEMRQLRYGRKPHVYRILFSIEGETVTFLRIWDGRRKQLPAH
jgi:toxin ParE1/3/4